MSLLVLLTWAQAAPAKEWWLIEKRGDAEAAMILLVDKESSAGNGEIKSIHAQMVLSVPMQKSVTSIISEMEFDCARRRARVVTLELRDAQGRGVEDSSPDKGLTLPAQEVTEPAGKAILAFTCEGSRSGFQRIGSDKQLVSEARRIFAAMAAPLAGTSTPPPLDPATLETLRQARIREDAQRMERLIRLALREKGCGLGASCDEYGKSLDIRAITCRETRNESPRARTCSFQVASTMRAAVPCTVDVNESSGITGYYWDYHADYRPDPKRMPDPPGSLIMSVPNVGPSTLKCSGELPSPQP